MDLIKQSIDLEKIHRIYINDIKGNSLESYEAVKETIKIVEEKLKMKKSQFEHSLIKQSGYGSPMKSHNDKSLSKISVVQDENNIMKSRIEDKNYSAQDFYSITIEYKKQGKVNMIGAKSD